MVTQVLCVPRGAWLLQSGGAAQLARMVIRLGRERGFRTICIVRRADAAAPSYWVRREPPGPAPETMKRQF
jgi:hypothetical protein